VPPSFTQLAIKAISVALIPHDEIWWVPFSEGKVRHSVCTNIVRDNFAGYRAGKSGLKKVAPGFRKSF